MATQNNSETKKGNPIAQVFSILGFLGITVLSLLGLLYILHGDMVMSAIFGLVILSAIVFITKILVENKIKVRTYQNLKPEFILGFLYFIVVIITFPFIFHYIDIEANRKDDLKELGKNKVETITDLKLEYKSVIDKKKRTFRASVEDNLKLYFRTQNSEYKDALVTLIGEVDFTEYDDSPSDSEIKTTVEEQVENAIQDGFKRIETEHDLGFVATKSKDYVQKAKKVFDSWKLLKVSSTYHEIDNEYEKVYTKMKEKMQGFEASPSKVKNMQIDNAMNSLLGVSIVNLLWITFVILLLHFATLIEYITAKRHNSVLTYKAKPSAEKADDGGWNVD